MTVHLLGIRHHGPGSARSVVRALERIDPDVVLLEAPADVGPALEHVGDTGLVAPVALLAWVIAEPGRALFLPFAGFSPEWQTLRWAATARREVRPIDLPVAVTLAGERTAAEHPMSVDGSTDERADGREALSCDGADDADRQLIGGRGPVDPIGDLARAAGDLDPERWWEDVIEHRGDGEPAFEAVAEAMGAAREGFVPSLGEMRREAHMRRAIRAALRDGHQEVAVVCGAWHVPALDVGSTTATTDARTLRGMAKVKAGVAWVPWSHRRLMAASGYGAGVPSPGWYAHVFDHPGPDGVARFFVGAAHTLRRHGHAASPDHLIAGTRLAGALAALRDRPRPGLTEVLDAAGAVTGNLDLIRRELVVGDVLGSVPDSAPQVPLVRDLARQQRSARLRPDVAPRRLDVDLRTPAGRRKSVLLHRLSALDVPWGRREADPGSTGSFRERWTLVWEPELSVRLVERSALGTTVEAAAVARLRERAASASSLVELVGVLDRALLGDLPAAVEPAVRRLADRAATDPDVGHLADALSPLSTALRYGDVRGTDASSLRRVFDGIVVRVLAGLEPACAAVDGTVAAVMAERLTGVRAALAVVDHDARRHAFPAVLEQLADGPRHHGLLQGRATRLLHDGGDWSAGRAGRRLGRALSGGTPPADGAAFVEGFLAGSGAVLVHDRALLDVIDRWLSSLRPHAFDDVVALLRRTFGQFEPAERRQIMALVVDVDDPFRRATFGADVDADRADRAMATVRTMLGLPEVVRDEP